MLIDVRVITSQYMLCTHLGPICCACAKQKCLPPVTLRAAPPIARLSLRHRAVCESTHARTEPETACGPKGPRRARNAVLLRVVPERREPSLSSLREGLAHRSPKPSLSCSVRRAVSSRNDTHAQLSGASRFSVPPTLQGAGQRPYEGRRSLRSEPHTTSARRWQGRGI